MSSNNKWTGVITNVQKVIETPLIPGEEGRLISMTLFITLSDGTKITKSSPLGGDFKIGDNVDSDNGILFYKT